MPEEQHPHDDPEQDDEDSYNEDWSPLPHTLSDVQTSRFVAAVLASAPGLDQLSCYLALLAHPRLADSGNFVKRHRTAESSVTYLLQMT